MPTYPYPRPALTVDMVAIDTIDATPHVLLILRKNPPFENCWALPGGFVEENEDLLDAALRETMEETGLFIPKNDPNLQQIGSFGAPHRDPRGWTVSVAYTIKGDLRSQKIAAADDAKALQWFAINALPDMAFDHAAIIIKAL
jgi:8-oxo-dGTP diphosphatase